MSFANRLTTIQSMYNGRAGTYDSEGSFHTLQAADYIDYMNLSEGLSVLDLACGTGAIAIPAARIVGQRGRVVGVDISDHSLAIARGKATNGNLSITFIHHDIENLEAVKEIQTESFDIIICASAFTLLGNPANAVKRWAPLLKTGGKMIFDVPTKDPKVAGYLLDIVAAELDTPVVFDRLSLDSVEKLKQLVDDAGLDSSESFGSRTYEETEIDAANASQIFDKYVGQEEWFGGGYSALDDPAVRGLANRSFCEKMREQAGENGMIKEKLRFNVAVGKKF
jgi:ubiquinone/menaquinone biosynthesis C-methylase UbiE